MHTVPTLRKYYSESLGVFSRIAQLDNLISQDNNDSEEDAEVIKSKWVLIQLTDMGMKKILFSKHLGFSYGKTIQAYFVLRELKYFEGTQEELLSRVLEKLEDYAPAAAFDFNFELEKSNPNVQFIPPEESIKNEGEITCEICYLDYPENNILKPLKCEHKFCKTCYSSYLEDKIKNNKVKNNFLLSQN
jgi:hypothetical protein